MGPAFHQCETLGDDDLRILDQIAETDNICQFIDTGLNELNIVVYTAGYVKLNLPPLLLPVHLPSRLKNLYGRSRASPPCIFTTSILNFGGSPACLSSICAFSVGLGWSFLMMPLACDKCHLSAMKVASLVCHVPAMVGQPDSARHHLFMTDWA